MSILYLRIVIILYVFLPKSMNKEIYTIKEPENCELPYKFVSNIEIYQVETNIYVNGKIKNHSNKNAEISEESNNSDTEISFETHTSREFPKINLFPNDEKDRDLFKFNIEEPFSFNHLIFTNKKFPNCIFYLKREEEGIISGYDFRIEFKNREESLAYGIEIFYKNRKDYKAFTSESNTIMVAIGNRKLGKTWFTSSITMTADLSPDDTVNTNGIAGVFHKRHRSIFVDTEGLDTPLISKKFFNITGKYKDIDAEKEEIEKDENFKKLVRDAFLETSKVIGLIVDQDTIQTREYIRELVKKYENSKFIMVIHNFQKLTVNDVKQRVNKDILSVDNPKEIEIPGTPVKAYLDEDFERSGVRIYHVILLNQDSSSHENKETFDHIIQKINEYHKRIDPIKNFVLKLNELIKESADTDIPDDVKCVQIEKVNEETDLITFPNQEKCNVWKNIKTIDTNYPYNLYLQNSLLYLEIDVPGLYSRDQLDEEKTYINISNTGKKNEFSITVEMKFKKLKGSTSNYNDAPEIVMFRNIKRKNEINIKHKFKYKVKKRWGFINEYETFLKGGIFTIMFPYTKL